jgi:hypothetical protein
LHTSQENKGKREIVLEKEIKKRRMKCIDNQLFATQGSGGYQVYDRLFNIWLRRNY